MIHRLLRLALALLAPAVLTGCLLVPGKFTAHMSVNADRSFAFSYVGEVYSINDADLMKGMNPNGSGPTPSGTSFKATADDPSTPEDSEAKNRAIAVALSKEEGFKQVQYLGKGRFSIDYEIKGRLDHTFLWPYNIDAEVIFPFVAAELRSGGTVRVQAPGFANSGKDTGGMGGADGPAAKLDGTFTLDTDAEVVSQNTETGVKTVGGRKVMSWAATPTTKTAPLAMLKFAQ